MSVNEKKKDLKGYAIVVAGFFAVVFVFLWILDAWVIPPLVHSGKLVDTPNLKGLSLEVAKAKLKSLNLNYRISSKQYSELYPENFVINQTPPPGYRVKEGRHINLIISEGGESTTVPFLKGKALRTARIALLNRNLALGSVNYEYCDTVGSDTVLSQSLPAGSKTSVNSYVDLTVSKGPEARISVPSLVGKTFAEAQEELEKLNLQVGMITNTYDDIYSATYKRNTIVEQYPEAGAIVAKNAKIDLTIFR